MIQTDLLFKLILMYVVMQIEHFFINMMENIGNELALVMAQVVAEEEIQFLLVLLALI